MSLFIDLYELTMAQVYFNEKRDAKAVFNFFVREDGKRNYYIFSGLSDLLCFLEDFRFDSREIEYLEALGKFEEPFLRYLEEFRFRGDLWALAEGEVFFANEPVVQVEGSLIETQIIETALINILQLPIMSTTKALRCKSVAKDTLLVDFGARRAQSMEAADIVARSCVIGGFAATSNLEAAKRYSLKPVGTMAHSFVLSYESEAEAFRAFARHYPKDTIFLVDTFDTLEGVKRVIELAKEGVFVKGIRLDSGDVVELAKKSRQMFDRAGLKDVKIFVSGGVDEYMIRDALEAGAPVDAWGVGTKLAVSADEPYLDCAYKLVEVDGVPKMKFSTSKVTLPGKKRLYRKNGEKIEDTITLFDESCEGEELLHLWMRDGRICKELPPLEDISKKAQKALEILPKQLLDIDRHVNFEPKLSQELQRLLAAMTP